MKTLQRFYNQMDTVPTSVSWYLSDLGEARGKQELFTRQSPQKLKVLREHALIESAVSSNRIEGVQIENNRIATILKIAYKEFEDRLSQIKSPRGAKTELVERTIKNFSAEFSLNDLERACPGVSRDMVRRVLRDLQAKGNVECLGRGPGALWRKREKG